MRRWMTVLLACAALALMVPRTGLAAAAKEGKGDVLHVTYYYLPG